MPATQQSYLDALLDLVTQCFTVDVARRVAALRVDPDTRARVADLAAKANEGTLSEQERAEYAEYVEAADLLGILQAKARRVLAQHGS